MVLVLWDYWKSHILAEVQNLFSSSTATDVVLYIGQRRLETHSFILVMFSRFLKEIISSAVKEDSFEPPLVISFPDFSYESIEFMVHFMYSGEITIPDEYLNEVIELSNLLGIKGLEDLAPFMINPPNQLELEINAEDEILDSSSFDDDMDLKIKDIIKKKKIKAEIIPIVKRKRTKKSDAEESTPNQKRKRVNRKRDRKRKFKKEYPEGPNFLDCYSIKENFLSEAEKYIKCTVDLPNIGNWPLSRFGVNLQKTRDDQYTPPPNLKSSKRVANRFRREMSHFWHRLTTRYTEGQRSILVRGIPDHIIQNFYGQLLNGITLIEFLEKNTITSDELKTILMMLMVSAEVNMDLAVEAFTGVNFQPLYIDRIEEGLEIFKNSDTFLSEIARNQWISDFDLSHEIEKRGVKRNEKFKNFDKLLHRAVELSPGGFNEQNLLAVAPEAEEYVKEFQQIYEYHKNMIFLPMACYEMRMDSAVSSVKFNKTSAEEAARMHMVPLVHLIQRTADCSVESNLRFEYRTGKPRCTGRKSKLSLALQQAIEDVRAGGDLEKALVFHKIRNPKLRKIIEYNIKRPNPPLNELYDSRFQRAIQMVRNDGLNIFEAACHCVVNYRTLHARLKKMKIKSPAAVKLETSSRFGLWSSKEHVLKNAIISANSGTPLDEVFKEFKIVNKWTQKIIEYNVGRADAPLDVPFRMRLLKAVDMVRKENAFFTEAACSNIVSLAALRRYLSQVGWMVSQGKRVFCERKRASGFWSKIDLQLRRAIEDVRSGIPLEEALKTHALKCRKSRQIVKYNINVPTPPLDKPYRERFEGAIASIDSRDMDVTSAACHYIVPYPVLWNYFNKGKSLGSEEEASSIKIQLFDSEVSFDKENDSLELEVTSKSEEAINGNKEDNIANDENRPIMLHNVKEGFKGMKMMDAVIQARKGDSVLKACETHMVNSREMRYVVNYNKDCASPPLHLPFDKRFQMAVSLVKTKGLPILQAASRAIVHPNVLRHYLSKNSSDDDLLSVSVDDDDSFNDKQHWSNQEKRLRNAIIDANSGMDLNKVFKIHNLNLRNQRVVRYNINRPDAPMDEPFDERLQKALLMVNQGKKASDAAKKWIVNPGAIYNHFNKVKAKSFTPESKISSCKNGGKIKAVKGKSVSNISKSKTNASLKSFSKNKITKVIENRGKMKSNDRTKMTLRPKRKLKFTFKMKDADDYLEDSEEEYNPAEDI